MKPLAQLVSALLLGAAGNAYAVGSLVDLAVYDRTEGRPLPAYYHEGRHYVVGRPGNEYQVVIRNRSGADVLAVGSVDGVNVITGETASPGQSGYVLAPWGMLEIKGWRKNLKRTAAFYFTELEDSYAARTGRPENVGVIGVAVFKRKAQWTPPPAEISRRDSASGAGASADSAGQAAPAAPSARAEAQAPEKSLGTGHGRNEASPAQYTSFERASDQPAEVITLYYDSYRNLLARGVIREPRTPRPFPARFVPDPPR